MTRVNKNITVNAIDKEIVITKSFYKKASAYGTREYELLKQVMKDNKTFNIIIKSPKGGNDNGLTFKRMEEYIKTQPNSEENLREFNAVKAVAKAKGALYMHTKKWFLNKFKDYKGEITNSEIASVHNAELAVA